MLRENYEGSRRNKKKACDSRSRGSEGRRSEDGDKVIRGGKMIGNKGKKVVRESG